MRILYAEDERDLNDLVTRRLVAEGYGVDSCLDGQQAWDYLQAADYDAAILDIMMPHLDGLSVLKKLRAAGKTTPVLLLTARDAVPDKITGLDSGADDYMTKPFNILEVKARIKTILRRAGAGKEAPKMEITAGDITININTRSVISHGEPVNLTVKEFDLLNLFMSNIGKIYSRDELLETIWGFDYIGDFRTVDVHIRRLREKIEKDPANPKHIMTKWGVGYYFAE